MMRVKIAEPRNKNSMPAHMCVHFSGVIQFASAAIQFASQAGYKTAWDSEDLVEFSGAGSDDAIVAKTNPQKEQPSVPFTM